MGKRKKPLLENVSIIDIGAEGKAIAKIENKVLFIPYGLPGDIVDIQVTSSRRKFFEGYIVKYHKHADDTAEPFCSHFKICGGCKWQHLPYKKQLEYKQKQVIDNFERLGKLSGFKVNNILASEDTTYYRNKLEFTFSDSRWLTNEELKSDIKYSNRNGLGFHIPKKFDKVLDIEKCYLQKSPSNEIRTEVKEFALKNDYSFFNIINQEGFLRNLIIRTSELNETMVIFSFFYEDKEKRENLLNHIANKFPEITALLYVINEKPNEIILDLDIKTFKGKNYILDKMDGLKFKIGPKSFYQTNSKQANQLYSAALKMLNPQKDSIVYDLYCGTGTITAFIARHCKKAIGIELVPEAIDDAKENAKLNKIKNTEFYSGDVKEILNTDFFEQNGKPDYIMVDPPRAGLHPSVIDIINNADVPVIVYISCNPATQARDISLLSNNYTVEEILPVDMFPHTHHVENVARLAKRQ